MIKTSYVLTNEKLLGVVVVVAVVAAVSVVVVSVVVPGNVPENPGKIEDIVNNVSGFHFLIC